MNLLRLTLNFLYLFSKVSLLSQFLTIKPVRRREKKSRQTPHKIQRGELTAVRIASGAKFRENQSGAPKKKANKNMPINPMPSIPIKIIIIPNRRSSDSVLLYCVFNCPPFFLMLSAKIY